LGLCGKRLNCMAVVFRQMAMDFSLRRRP
jgi:hypothetical protein